MTKGQTRSILGRPDRSFYSKKFRADEFVYTHTTKKTADGLSGKYTNYYLFKNDRLPIRIRIFLGYTSVCSRRMTTGEL